MKIHNTGFRQGDAGLAINFVEDLVDIHSKILAPEEKSQKILARVDSFLNTNSRS
jgi:hypothetical protein